MLPSSYPGTGHDRAGGIAALYLSLAYLAAMPYFLLVVDYPQATTTAEKVGSLVRNHHSMYAMYLVSYVLLGVVLAVLVLSLFDRLRRGNELAARVATAVGLTWSIALTLSGMVFNHGMGAVVSLAGSSPEEAARTWQAIEPVAEALGGAGGETLGGLWLLLVSGIALRDRAWPAALGWFGATIGFVGVLSTVPALHAGAYVFGLLQIVWFAWVGVVLLSNRANDPRPAEPRPALGAV